MWLEDTSSVPLAYVPGLLMMWAMNRSFDQNAQSQHTHKSVFCCNFYSLILQIIFYSLIPIKEQVILKITEKRKSWKKT